MGKSSGAAPGPFSSTEDQGRGASLGSVPGHLGVPPGLQPSGGLTPTKQRQLLCVQVGFCPIVHRASYSERAKLAEGALWGGGPTSVMDPSQAELNAITTLEHVAQWAGLDDSLRDTLIRDLGSPINLRDVAFIKRHVWDAAVLLIRRAVPPASAGDKPTERELTPVEQSRLEVFRRVALLKVKRTPDTAGNEEVAGPSKPPAHGEPHTNQSIPNDVVAHVGDAEIGFETEGGKLQQSSVRAMYLRYKARFGVEPPHDNDPSLEQLSLLALHIKAGTIPYFDMAMWEPDGSPRPDKASFKSSTFEGPTGEVVKVDTPGPASVDSWEKLFKVYIVAMTLLGASEPDELDKYREFVKGLSDRFGPSCWGFICRADSKMRSQHIEEIRKNLEIEGVPSSSPWSAAFTEAVRAQDFWDAEVISPSTTLLGRNRGTLVGLSSESSVESSPDRSPSRRESPKSSKPKVSKKGKKKYTGENKSRWDFSAGHYSLNRKGLEICINFNIGQCGNGKPQSRCAYHRSHQCNHCLGPHQATQCPTKSTSEAHLSLVG